MTNTREENVAELEREAEELKREQVARDLARLPASAEDIDVDAHAETSTGEDGIWVQAWILVPHGDIDEELARNRP